MNWSNLKDKIYMSHNIIQFAIIIQILNNKNEYEF